MKKAFLIIDMLNDFVLENAPLEVPQAREIIPNIKRELEKARLEKMPVIYICDAHEEDDPEFKIWPKHCVKGTKGAEIIEELKPQPQDIIVEKISYSGFYHTNLDEILKKMGIGSLKITGILTNICVLYTAVDALMRGYEIEILQDCVASLNEEDHRFALRQLTEVLKPRK